MSVTRRVATWLAAVAAVSAFGLLAACRGPSAPTVAEEPAPDGSPAATADVVVATYVVPDGTPTAAFNTRWLRGGDVVMTLISPSGRVISRDDLGTGVTHRNTSAHENYVVTDPEPGQWTVELRGADIALGEGEDEVQLTFYAEPIPNEQPVAVIHLTQEGNSVTADASGSYDPDGEIVSWEWYFDDGTHTEGERVTHEYTEPGSYIVQLIVTDNDGRPGFATHPEVIEIGGSDDP